MSTSNPVRAACALTLLSLLLMVAPAHAQGALALDDLRIELWPEFDQPATLVILSGTLAPGAAFPMELTVHIPAAAGQPHAVASRDASGKLLNAPFATAAAGNELAVRLTLSYDNFHLEYYDPGLTFKGDTRDYTFNWTTAYAVQSATVVVQQPVDASGLNLDPAFSPLGVGEYGLSYFEASLGQLAAGQPVSVHLSYSKSGSRLSAETVTDQSVPLSAAVEPTPSLAASPWLIGGLVLGALLLIGGAGWFVWGYLPGQGRSTSTGARRGRRRRKTAGAVGPALIPADRPSAANSADGGPARFCTQCGELLQPGDRFCRNCGARAAS